MLGRQMNKSRTIRTILCFIMTAAVSLPSFGCAYERNKHSSEPTYLPTVAPISEINVDPKDVSLQKSSKDQFYGHEAIYLDSPNLSLDPNDKKTVHYIDNVTFLDDVLLVRERTIFQSAEPKNEPAPIAAQDAGLNVSFMDEDGTSYIANVFVAYNFEGNILGTINLGSPGQGSDPVIIRDDPNGNIVFFYDGYDPETEGCYIWVAKYSRTGELLKKPSPIVLIGDMNQLTGALCTSEGHYILTTADQVYKINSDYEIEIEISLNLQEECYCTGVYREDDNYYIELLDQQDSEERKMMVGFSDLVTNGWDMKSSKDSLSSMKIIQSGESLYAMTKNALGKLNMSTGEFRQVIDWNQTDIPRYTLNQGEIKVIHDGEMTSPIQVLNKEITDRNDSEDRSKVDDSSAELLVCHTEDTDIGNTAVLYHISKSVTNPHDGQTVIWLGGINFDNQALCRAVAEYNKNNTNNVWIKITDYSDYSSDGKAKAVESIYSQLVSGSGPDIICGLADYAKFDKNRFLTDLNPYIDSINGVDRKDFFTNILSVYETQGKLYQIPVSFTVNGLMWDVDDFYDSTYTLDSMAQVVCNREDDVDMIHGIYGEDTFKTVMRSMLINHVDYATGEIAYSEEELSLILSILASSLQKDYISYTYSENENTFISWSNSQALSYAMTLGIRTGWIYGSPKDVNILGYPNSDGAGYVAKTNISLGIASSSNNTERAWDFIRYMLSLEVQQKITSGLEGSDPSYEETLPVNSLALEAIVSTPHVASEGDFAIVEPESKEWTREDVEYVKEIIADTDKRLTIDTMLEKIVYDEVCQMVTDGKSVMEATRDLQSRIKDIV